MFRFQLPGEADRPWFRIGTVAIGTAALAALIVVVSMVVYAFEGLVSGGAEHPIRQWLSFTTTDVQRGQIWRLATWWIPNEPSLWTVIDAALIFYFGAMIEGALGRNRMVTYMATIIIAPAVLLTLIDLAVDLPSAMFGASSLSRALFLTLVVYMPGLRFFFGIPAWVLAVVLVGVDILGAMAQGNTTYLVFTIVVAACAVLAARAFGLAEQVPWIPKLPLPASGGGGSTRTSARRKQSHLEAVDPVADQLEQMEIDAILEQIASSGMDSLSREQKRKLESYSRKQRRRRKDS